MDIFMDLPANCLRSDPVANHPRGNRHPNPVFDVRVLIFRGVKSTTFRVNFPRANSQPKPLVADKRTFVHFQTFPSENVQKKFRTR
jgi:hypothetical protein